MNKVTPSLTFFEEEPPQIILRDGFILDIFDYGKAYETIATGNGPKNIKPFIGTLTSKEAGLRTLGMGYIPDANNTIYYLVICNGADGKGSSVYPILKKAMEEFPEFMWQAGFTLVSFLKNSDIAALPGGEWLRISERKV